MVVYLILLAVLCLFALRPRSRPLLVVSFFLLFIVEAFRAYSVGTDTINYISANSNILHSSSFAVKGLEIGWTGLVYLNSWIFEDISRPMIIEATLLFLAPLFIVASRWCRKRAGMVILLSFLLYFYFNSFNITRQSIAMSWCLWAYYCYERKETKRSILFFLIAVSFHTTALMMAALPLIRKIKINLIWTCALLGGSFLFGTLNLISPIVSLIAGNELYSIYADAFLADASSFSPTRLALNVLVIYLFIKTKGRDQLWNFVFIGVVLLNFFSSLPFVARLAQYFLLFQIILFPRIRSKNARLVTWAYSFVTFAFLLYSNVGEVLPYAFG